MHSQFEITRIYTFDETSTLTAPVHYWQKPCEHMDSLGQTIFNQEMDKISV